MKNLRMRAMIFFLGLCGLLFYGSWRYTISVAQETFEADILKVKQAFAEGVKAADTAVDSLSAFAAVVKDISQDDFSIFADKLMFNNYFITSTSYYLRVDDKSQPMVEQFLKSKNLGEFFLEGGTPATPEVITATTRPEYLILYATNSTAKESSYFGWDIFSDAYKASLIKQAIDGKKSVGSNTFLLENGNVALEIFSPVLAKIDDQSTPNVIGIISTTIDLTLLLGDTKWREGVTLFMTTSLNNEAIEKDIFRHVDRAADQKIIFAELTSKLYLDKFGQNIGLKFSKGLFWERINPGAIFLTIIGLLLLGLLSHYLINTYEKLQKSLIDLADINKNLEERVKDRTRDLSVAHAEIKEILDNLDEIVLPINGQGIISTTYSLASKRLLGLEDIGNKTIGEVLFKDLNRLNESDSRHLFTISMLSGFNEFQWFLSANDLLPLVSYHHPNHPEKPRTLSMKYSPIFVEDKFTKMIIVANDISEVLALKASLAEAEKSSSLSQLIIGEILQSEKTNIATFFGESEVRISNIKTYEPTDQSQRPELLRDLHTLKGSARSAGLKTFASQVHKTEDTLEHAEGAISPEAKTELIRTVDTYAEYAKVYQRIFAGSGKNPNDSDFLTWIASSLSSNKIPNRDLAKLIHDFNSNLIYDAGAQFLSFAPATAELASQLGKKINFQGPGRALYLAMETRSILNEAFTHCTRNAIDHGIESIEERQKSNKAEAGTLTLSYAGLPDGKIQVIVGDDGRGINLRKVHEIALKKALVATSFENFSHEEVLELLFLPGFSTKESVSEISGRGVGLDAVRHGCQKMQIGVHLESTQGQGSRFVLTFPSHLVGYLQPIFETGPTHVRL